MPDKIQACNTLQAKEHSSFISKSKSRYQGMKIANKDTESLQPLQTCYQVQKKAGLKNRNSVKGSKDKCTGCKFAINVFLSRADDKWYISWNNRKRLYEHFSHNNHFPVHADHIWISRRNLISDKCRKFIEDMLTNGISVAVVIQLVYVRFHIRISPNVVKNMATEALETMHFLDGYDSPSSITAAEKLINLLKSLDNLSYIVLNLI